MYSAAQLKQFEKLATNTPNLKNHRNDGTNLRNEPKEGFVRLKDNRVVKVSDLTGASKPRTVHLAPELSSEELQEVEAQAAAHPELRNCSGIGLDKTTGKPKKGFYLLESGKVISVKKLNAAVTDAAKNIEANTD